ncbi:MAG: dihydrodipicolinate synthase family protein [Planctomycetaceae bacterium]
MPNFDRSRLRTVHLVPLTAFDSRDRIDEDVQREHTARMAAAGIRVFLPAAGTGEFHNLSPDEIVQLVRITREAAGPDAAIFAPVGYQLAQAIDVGRRSIDAGADGIMLMPLAHPYVSDVGARDYFTAILDAVKRPALVYKKAAVPSDALLLELAEHPHVVGVKYAQNELQHFRNVVLADGGRIEWLCGSAERFAPFYMLAGAPGYTTGAGNVCPHLTLAMHAAFAAGEYDEGMRLQSLILPIEEYRARAGDSYNISMLKHAASWQDLDFGQPRPPQRCLTDSERAEIDELLEPILEVERDLAGELAETGLAH